MALEMNDSGFGVIVIRSFNDSGDQYHVAHSNPRIRGLHLRNLLAA
jgi:hypothetical protein